jgi:hypothetical protein
MHRTRLAQGLVAMVLALALFGAGARSAALGSASTRLRATTTRGLAVRWAIRNIYEVSLPPGSRGVRSLPSTPRELTEWPPREVGGGPTVYRRRFWVVPGKPRFVLRWVEKHGPGHFRAPDGEFDSDFFGEEEGRPPLPSRTAIRSAKHGEFVSTVTVTAAHLSHRRSAVRIDAYVTWRSDARAAK